MSEQFITNVNEKNLILTRAQGAVIARDFQTASRLYKQLLRDDPSNVDYLKELGSIYVKNNEDEKAIPYYEQIITFYPHYIEAMNSLGAIFRRLKRYEESIQILQRALDEGRQTAAVNYNLGFTYKEMGDFDDAIDAFTAVINENPSDVLAYNHMGSIYLAEKQYDKAIASYRKGLQVDPNHPILNYNLACTYNQAKMPNDAIRCFEKTLKVKPGWVEAIKDYSSVLINCQKTKEASDLVQKSIKLHPNDPKLLSMLGRIYLDQYDYDSAEKTFKRARNVDGNDIEILKGLAVALEKEDRPKEALEAVNSALAIEPANEDLNKQYVHTLLSAEYYDAAHDKVQDLYKNNGQRDPQVLDLYGQYYICTDQDQTAQQFYNQIEKNNRQYKEHILSAANRYDQIGQTEKAVEKAKEYVSKKADNPEGYNTLGKIYEKAGQYKEAVASYNKSKGLIKPNILADKKISKLSAMIEPEAIDEQPVVAAPVEVVQNEIAAPAVETVEDKADEEFDFGTMGDNVPMGEALLEKEEDFFDDMDQQLEEEYTEEVDETPEEPEEPAPSYKDYAKTPGTSMDNLEDENLSPFEDTYEEPKSTGEQLVPDADFDKKKNTKTDDDILDSMINNPSSEQSESASAAAPVETSEEPENNIFDAYGNAGSQGNGFGGESSDSGYGSNAGTGSGNGDGFGSESATGSGYDSGSGYDDGVGTWSGYGNSSGIEQPQYESSMNQFANEMQKRMQDAMMDSARFAMDSALNAQRMASQIAEEQEKLRNKVESMPQPQIQEPVTETVESLSSVEDDEPSIFDDLYVAPTSEDSDKITTELGAIKNTDTISAELEPIGQEFSVEDSNATFMNTDDVLQEINGETKSEQIEVTTDADNKDIPVVTDEKVSVGTEENISVVTEENVTVEERAAEMLNGITKILEDDDMAQLNASEVELFKKFLTFRDFLPEEEREKFDSGKIRMLAEYIIAKMSGKPGLLKTAQSLIKSGILGEEYNGYDVEIDNLELNNDLIKKVLYIMISLSAELEDKGLAQSLTNCAESVLERIELTEGKSEIFC